MNMVEQSLRARVQRLENRNAAMMLTLQRVILDLETSESVACAFAWDLSNEIDSTRAAAVNLSSDSYYNATTDAADCIEEGVIAGWADALIDAAKIVEKFQGINRNPDGSIESILPTQAADPNASAP